MILTNTAATNDQYMASLFLDEYNSPERPSQDRRASSGLPMIPEDSSREESIQRHEPLKSVAVTFQQEDDTEFHLPSLREEHAIAIVGSDRIYRSVNPDLPRGFMIQRESNRTPRPPSWMMEYLTSDVGWGYAYNRAMPAPHRSRVLGEFAVIAHQGSGWTFRPRSRVIASPTTDTSGERIYKNTIWTEILERFDVIAQREDNWDGLESKKPIKSSLVHAKRLIEKLLDDILSAGYSWRRFKPLIFSDEDGYITIRWIGEGKRLHFQFKGKEVEYITLERINTKRKMGGDTIRDDNCFEIWEWLING